MVSVNFFCFMKSSKKSAAGPVAFVMLSDGESNPASKDLSARTAVFCLPAMLPCYGLRTALSGSKSGF
jgi:hypothetical protein